jgi:hypothetical protein
MAWRLNLLSAVAGALAAATTALVVYHLSLWPGTGPRKQLRPAAEQPPAGPPSNRPNDTSAWPAALVAGLALSFGLTLWQWSIIAGVRSINILFFALLTLEAIVWQQQRQRGQSRAAARTLAWLAVTVGLSLAHHRTTVFYLPSLIGWIWWHDRRLLGQPRRLLRLLALALLPLALYLFIYIRGINHPPYTHEPITDLQSFWFLVGSGDSTGLFFSIDPLYLGPRLAFIWQDLLRQLSLPGVVLAGWGGLILLWRRPGHFLFQGLLVLLLLFFTLDFEVVNLNEAPTWYLMPAYFIFAVWLGVGLNGILGSGRKAWGIEIGEWGVGAKRGDWRTGIGDWGAGIGKLLLAGGVLVVLGYWLAWPNWQQIYRDSTAPLDEWRQLLRGEQARRFVENSLPEVAAEAVILGDWEQYTPLNYYQFIYGLRPDVTVRNPLNRWPEQAAAAQAAGRPVYLSRKTTDLIGTPHLSMVGPLVHLRTAPRFDVPAGIIPLNANLENELELIGYRAEVVPQKTPGGRWAGPIIQMWLYWRVPQATTWDYALSLRLLNAAGQEIYRRDVSHPVLSSYPTSLWTAGEVVTDFYELPFPPASGPLTVQLLPYRLEGANQWHNLSLTGTEPPQEGVLVGPLEEK